MDVDSLPYPQKLFPDPAHIKREIDPTPGWPSIKG